MKVRLVTFDDWEAIYLNGRLQIEAESLDPTELWWVMNRGDPETKLKDIDFKSVMAGQGDCDLVDLRGCAWIAVEDFTDTEGLS